ncbi:TonB-dependent hemoglobin/transferrin/lactoferrin family receptor [Haemophilus paraphrohaemolyticus]|uniref:TonB-dependent hemoglobin/transferrin/lactoferrin family receptor n=1 Tax=Haemophilus paraphrohaemolyticus TaxID=736 RepID=A0A369ZRH7_9PAST|nr:TonB-dependent hemoglobin/transferrin/lactoferrin family receptor [Haemophilus paraphrohaemolyticus]RDF11384.1 TonB-dependent hemoglobin/transferrin/lactoferrin family receptor [Haemophilus paraphrohaemolyticus]
MARQFALSLGAICVAVALNSYAEEETTLGTVHVEGTQVKANQIKKTRKAIQEELIANNHDLVRYTTDVGISDNGRRAKGFAMRGVEGNRVGISVDGVNLPDSEENSLYARYGNFNSSRLAIDPELVQGIDIMRGSDSFNSGSGSLGGSVNYRTLGADDIVFPENNWGILLKNSYTSKNREWTHTAGVGYKDEKFDMALLYSYRDGHEMKSNGAGEAIRGRERGVPDPATHKNRSYLAKFGYFITPSHKVSLSFNAQRDNNWVDEESYSLTQSSWREVRDFGKRYNSNLAYEYFPENNRLLSYIKADIDLQKTEIGSENTKGNQQYDFSVPYWPKPLKPERKADEIQTTNMKNKFKRASLRVDSVPLDILWGTHQFTVRTSVSQKDFENENNKTFYTGERTEESIQHPVRTRSFMAQLQDNVIWNEIFSSQLGVRYDWDQLVPQDLKATCRACSAKPASNTFQSVSGSLGLDAQVNETWKVGYNISTGYRVPTASEMYFSFEHPQGNWFPNPKLKAEQALNNSIHIQAEHSVGTYNLNVYHSRYKNFLTEQESLFEKINSYYFEDSRSGEPFYTTIAQQAVNIDRATVSGVELTTKTNLDQVISFIPEGWKFLANLGYSKGRLKGTEASMLSIQPIKVILGFGYEDPEDRWGLNARMTYLGAKKAKDAQVIDYSSRRYKEIKTYPYLNGSATLFDVYGFYKINKHVILRAGIYNILNRKYHTWDVLRGINQFSTTDAVDPQRKGLERFYAPGRNFAGAVEIRF